MDKKDLNQTTKKAQKLRRELREEYKRLSDSFNNITAKFQEVVLQMDKFLGELCE